MAKADAAGSSPGARTSGDSPESSNHGKLTEKAQRMVQIGLPWPDEEEMQHETRKMVVDAGVAWHIDKARSGRCLNETEAPVVLSNPACSPPVVCSRGLRGLHRCRQALPCVKALAFGCCHSPSVHARCCVASACLRKLAATVMLRV